MKDFQCEGEWWIPGSETDRQQGTLTFSSTEGAQLLLSPKWGFDQTFPVVHPIIFGETSDGIAITLQECESDWATFFDPSVAGGLYNVCIAYIGTHLQVPENAAFQKVDVRYTYLSDWAVNRHDLKRREANSGVFYRTKPDDIVVGVANAQIRITYVGHEWEKPLEPPVSPPSPDCTVLTIESFSGQTLREFLSQFVNPIRNLVSFAESKPSDITEIRLYQQQNGDAGCRGSGVLVLFRQLLRAHDWRNPPSLTTKLFGLQEVLPSLKGVLQKWLSMHENLRVALDPYFSMMYLNEGFLEHRFLTIVSTLEAYHRIRQGEKCNKVMADEVFQAILQAAADAAPELYRNWVKEKFKHSNQPTLRKRLKEIIGILREAGESAEVPKWPPSKTKSESFVYKVVQTRNYFVHGLEEKREEVAQGEELYYLLSNLEQLLKGLVLHDLGLLTAQRRKQLADKWFGFG